MMNSIRNPQILAAALAGALLSATQAPAAPAQDRPPATLELAQRTFKKLDANQDGAISLTEARRGGLTVSSFNSQDADADQRLSEEEFTLLYRGLLSSRGYPIATDLDRAVKDIQDGRKKAAEAQRVQEARKKQAELDAKRTQDAPPASSRRTSTPSAPRTQARSRPSRAPRHAPPPLASSRRTSTPSAPRTHARSRLSRAPRHAPPPPARSRPSSTPSASRRRVRSRPSRAPRHAPPLPARSRRTSTLSAPRTHARSRLLAVTGQIARNRPRFRRSPRRSRRPESPRMARLRRPLTPRGAPAEAPAEATARAPDGLTPTSPGTCHPSARAPSPQEGGGARVGQKPEEFGTLIASGGVASEGAVLRRVVLDR